MTYDDDATAGEEGGDEGGGSDGSGGASGPGEHMQMIASSPVKPPPAPVLKAMRPLPVD